MGEEEAGRIQSRTQGHRGKDLLGLGGANTDFHENILRGCVRKTCSGALARQR